MIKRSSPLCLAIVGLLAVLTLFVVPALAQDVDGDGILNQNDRCPRQAGEQEGEGCPFAGETKTDTDQQGKAQLKQDQVKTIVPKLNLGLQVTSIKACNTGKLLSNTETTISVYTKTSPNQAKDQNDIYKIVANPVGYRPVEIRNFSTLEVSLGLLKVTFLAPSGQVCAQPCPVVKEKEISGDPVQGEESLGKWYSNGEGQEGNEGKKDDEKKGWPPKGVDSNNYELTGDFDDLYDKIFDEKDGKGPKINGERRAGSVNSSYNWRWWPEGKTSQTSEDPCKCKATAKVDKVKVSATITLTMPKWKGYDQASKEEKKKWDEFKQALRKHERRHIEITKQGAKDLKKAIKDAGPTTGKGKTCKKAWKDAVGKLGKKIKKAKDKSTKSTDQKQENYDDRTNHGKKQGATLGGR